MWNHVFSIPVITTPFNTIVNAIGIDLGTSRCFAAVKRKNGIETVHLDNGERFLPSYVSYDEKYAKCGKIVVGRMQYFSQSTIFDSKKIIGRTLDEIEIDEKWPFKLIQEKNKVFMEILIHNGERRKISAEEVAADLLKHIKHEAEMFQRKKLTKAVITVPIAFNETQKNATMEAAKLAGFDEAELLPEPVAAAFAYFIYEPIPYNSNILVFDLGGRTLDVYILKVRNGQIQIISKADDSKLGGSDFDAVLIKYFNNALCSKYNISVKEYKKYKLKVECQKIKESLSWRKNDMLDVEDFDFNQEEKILISREEFQNMSKPLLNKIKNIIIAGMYSSGYNANEINTVLHIGGGSRMPMIKKLLLELFPKSEHICEELPEEMFAKGAAFCAKYPNIKNRKTVPTYLQSGHIDDNEKFNQRKKPRYGIPRQETKYNDEIKAVGIDLGTSRCCAAVNRKNGITTVHLDNTGERLLPSYVSYDEENAIFGRTAVSRLRFFPKSIVFDSKRIIGRKLNDIEIDSNWPFSISQNNEKVVMGIKKFNVGAEITAEEVATDLLKYIKQKVEDFQGTKLENVVITVPAAFSEAQKNATTEAAKIAGFRNIKLLPEPIAAAFAYFLDRPIPNESTILLFDLGGGTLDVCIYKINENDIHIVTNTGDTKLGGRDFDTVLFNHFKNQLGIKYSISLNKDRKYKLILDCQRIKEDLSSVKSSFLNVDEFDPEVHQIIFVTCEEFESLTKPLLNRIRNTLLSAVQDSKYKENDINKILLVGGGSRMPMIKRLLLELFPQAEHICEDNPDEVVAIGAAYYAYDVFSNTTSS